VQATQIPVVTAVTGAASPALLPAA
jgi:hypothetical protein